jgi:hypothetical protein
MTVTRTEHLLTILAEECAEVAHRVSKAIRFGLEEVQPGQTLTNAERVREEVYDLTAAYRMLALAGALPPCGFHAGPEVIARMQSKVDKVERYLTFSAAVGLVDGSPADPNHPHPEAKTSEV